MQARFARSLQTFLRETSSGSSTVRTRAGQLVVADAGLAEELANARPASAAESTVFKPVGGVQVPRGEAVEIYRCFIRDLRIRGVGDVGSDAARTTSDREVEFLLNGGPLSGGPDGEQAGDVEGAALRRRMHRAVLDTTKAVVANTLWFRPTHETRGDVTSSVHESLRLIPPAWLLPRASGKEHQRLLPHFTGREFFLSPLAVHYRAARTLGALDFEPAKAPKETRATAGRDFAPFGFGQAKCFFRNDCIALAVACLVAIESRYRVQPPRRSQGVLRPKPLLRVAPLELRLR